MAFCEKRHHFIGNFVDQKAFYWLFEREGAILFIYFGQNYTGCRMGFQVMVHIYMEAGSLQGEATSSTRHVAPTRSILRLSSTYKQIAQH